MNKDLEQAKALLENNEEYTCAACRAGESFASEEHGITWVNLNASDDPAVSARYGVNGIPHQVIISPAGIVLDSWAGYGQGLLEQRLKTYLSD